MPRQSSAPRPAVGRGSASPRGPGAPHPVGGFAVGLLVFTALFVLTQMYSAIPLSGPVGKDLTGFILFIEASIGPLTASLTGNLVVLLAAFAALLAAAASFITVFNRLSTKEGAKA